MKAITILLLSCASVFAAEGDIHVFSLAHTNAVDNIYAKDEFTRDGETNLVRIFKVRPEGWAKVYHFYHSGQLVGNFVAMEGESVFNTEAGPYCLSLKYGPAGEILSARIGDKQGILLDEFVFTNGGFCPIEGPLRQNGLMKPKFGDESEFIKKAVESEARFKGQTTGKKGPTSQ